MSLPSDLRPVKHTYEPDGLNDGATCKRCGEAFSFGALHVEPPVDIPDDPAPRLCSCGHYTHKDRCWGGVPAYPEPKACHCQVRTP